VNKIYRGSWQWFREPDSRSPWRRQDTCHVQRHDAMQMRCRDAGGPRAIQALRVRRWWLASAVPANGGQVVVLAGSPGTRPGRQPHDPDHSLSCLAGPWVETARQPHPARFSVSAPGRPGQGLGSNTEPSAGLFQVSPFAPFLSHCPLPIVCPCPCRARWPAHPRGRRGCPLILFLLLALPPSQKV